MSFLSQGMRYGKTNLLLASVCSLLAFTCVAAILGDWRTQPLEVAFVALVLVVLPAYEYMPAAQAAECQAGGRDAPIGRVVIFSPP